MCTTALLPHNPLIFTWQGTELRNREFVTAAVHTEAGG